MDIQLPIDLADSKRPTVPVPDVREESELETVQILVVVDGQERESYAVHPHLWSMLRHQLDKMIDECPKGRVMYDGRWEQG